MEVDQAAVAAPSASGGLTDLDLDGMRALGIGLQDLSRTVGEALRAVDSLPIEAITPVLGPIGADFMSALLDATARHRTVLASLATVAGDAGSLVLATGQLYENTDANSASQLGAVDNWTEV